MSAASKNDIRRKGDWGDSRTLDGEECLRGY